MELFKYFTKVVSKSKSKTAAGATRSDYQIHLAALDTMFVALRAVRTFQPCGVIKAVSEEIEPEQALESGRAEINFHKWIGHDWVNETTEQLLTGYVPAAGIQDIANHLVYPAGLPVKVLPVLMPFYVDKSTGELVPNDQVQSVRHDDGFAKVYPLPPADQQRPGCTLRATPEMEIQAHKFPEQLQLTVPLTSQTQLTLFPAKSDENFRTNNLQTDAAARYASERRSNARFL